MTSSSPAQKRTVVHTPARWHGSGPSSAAQVTGTVVPSTARSTSPARMSCGSRARRYPPPLPRTLANKPADTMGRAICSRYFRDSSSCSATSRSDTFASGPACAMHTAKRNAYRPFDEISTIPPYRFQLLSPNRRNVCREPRAPNARGEPMRRLRRCPARPTGPPSRRTRTRRETPAGEPKLRAAASLGHREQASQRCTPRQRPHIRQHDDPGSPVGCAHRPVSPSEYIGLH